MRQFIIGLCLLLSFIAGAALPTIMAVQMYKDIEALPDGEAEYYRGAYDVCVTHTDDPGGCLEGVGKLRGLRMYERRSPGYEWPVPRFVAPPTPTRPHPADQQHG